MGCIRAGGRRIMVGELSVELSTSSHFLDFARNNVSYMIYNSTRFSKDAARCGVEVPHGGYLLLFCSSCYACTHLPHGEEYSLTYYCISNSIY